MLLVDDRLFIFTNDVALVVLLYPVPRLWRARLRIVDRLSFLRGSGFAAGVDARCLNWSKDSARRPAWSSGYEAHDPAHGGGLLRLHHLLEHFRRPVKLDPGFHELPIRVRDGGRGQRHLKG